MERIVATPGELDFAAPGRRDYFVRFEHPTLWGHHLVPVTAIVGDDATEGQGVVAIGSTHGDEYEGPVAIKHLLHRIHTNDVTGRVILIPVLNVAAFQADRRETPDDGVNLNRAFPGDEKGSLTYRFADFINRVIFPQVHVVLDVHSGGMVGRFEPLTSFHHIENLRQRKAMEEFARGFGCRFTMIYQNETAGLLPRQAEDLGKITVGTELGYGRSVSVRGVSMATQGILAASVRSGQLSGALPPNRHCPREEQILADTSDPTSSLLAEFDGHFEPTVECGEVVSEGRLVGYLHDFDRIDTPPVELQAPHDGYVIFQAWAARVLRGQIVTQIGKPVDWTE